MYYNRRKEKRKKKEEVQNYDENESLTYNPCNDFQ